VMLDLSRRGRDVRCFVAALEGWIVAALGEFGVKGEIRPGRVGVWVERPGGGEEKIAAIGVKLRRWVSFHGISLNVAPDLSHYGGIVPCGETSRGVTSLAAVGAGAEMTRVDAALKAAFVSIFGEVQAAAPPDQA
jgi:lipoyl(octanoyl) transferase